VFVAYGLMAFGIVQTFAGAGISGMWLVLVGMFLHQAANTSYARVGLRESLGHLAVSHVMTRDGVTVRPDDTLGALVDRFWEHHVASFPVADGDRVVGIASIAELQRIPREEWPRLRVRDVMRPMDETLRVRPTDSVDDALQRASANTLGRRAVVDNSDRLVGYLSTQDAARPSASAGRERRRRPCCAGRAAPP